MYERIIFDGEWAKEDTLPVAEAISIAERKLSDSASSAFGKTWICIREVVDGSEAIYCASRMGFLRVLSASTAAGLADKISLLGKSVAPHLEP